MARNQLAKQLVTFACPLQVSVQRGPAGCVRDANFLDQRLDFRGWRRCHTRDTERYREVDDRADGTERIRLDTEEPVLGQSAQECRALDEQDPLVLENVQQRNAESGEHAGNRALAIHALVENAEHQGGEDRRGRQPERQRHRTGGEIRWIETEIARQRDRAGHRDPARKQFLSLGNVRSKDALQQIVRDRARDSQEEPCGRGERGGESAGRDQGKQGEIITMLPNSPDVEAVVLGPNGILEGIKPGAVLVDMSSIAPLVSQKVGAAVREKGADMLDAPVSGGEPKAIDGTLAIMVGVIALGVAVAAWEVVVGAPNVGGTNGVSVAGSCELTVG